MAVKVQSRSLLRRGDLSRGSVLRSRLPRRQVVLLSMAVLTATASPLQEGRELFLIGGCSSCHTGEGGALLAGGDPLKTPFGTFYPPNITPDPETGIGRWREGDFLRAMQEGISPEGKPYYPAFPYPSYTKMGEEDLKALWRYLQTIPPVRRRSPDHDLHFPFNLRSLLWPWRWLFFKAERFRPDPSRSERWNRGAYLVEGPGHCGECHTPRNLLGAPVRKLAYGGAVLGEIEAPNITPSECGIGAWSDRDLLLFFQTGIKPDGDVAGGEMAKVIRDGLSKLPEEELRAIITYLRSLPPVPCREKERGKGPS